MPNNERLAVAAHLHNALRRKRGRVTDVEWMAQNDTHAHEIVWLALADAARADLLALAYRLRALIPPQPAAAVAGMPAAPGQRVAQAPPRHVRSMR